jgi:hypothetical protein
MLVWENLEDLPAPERHPLSGNICDQNLHELLRQYQIDKLYTLPPIMLTVLFWAPSICGNQYPGTFTLLRLLANIGWMRKFYH